MSHGDLYCQKCDNIIADEYHSVERYRCSQEQNKYRLLDKAFLKYNQRNRITFDNRGNITGGNLPKNKNILKELKKAIRKDLKEHLEGEAGRFLDHSYMYSKLKYDFKKKIVLWSLEDENSKENYQRAGIIKHEVKRGYPEYGFCKKCAKELKYKCNLCGSKLEKLANK